MNSILRAITSTVSTRIQASSSSDTLDKLNQKERKVLLPNSHGQPSMVDLQIPEAHRPKTNLRTALYTRARISGDSIITLGSP